MFKTISEDTLAEIVEKKSKFIANVFYVESVEEAEEKLNQLRKKYFDARHNCFAYSIYTQNGKIEKFSDDGEPSGTAGTPMLSILQNQNLSNVLVVVTRYFGGILLGTGGLVRAYSEATKKALNNTKTIEKDLGLEVRFTTSYADNQKMKYFLEQEKIKIVNIDYGENVIFFVEIVKEKYNHILKEKRELKFDILENKIIKEKFIEIM